MRLATMRQGWDNIYVWVFAHGRYYACVLMHVLHSGVYIPMHACVRDYYILVIVPCQVA